jgi:hypothetical protein
MTLSMLMFALMVCSLSAVTALVVVDAVQSHVKRSRTRRTPGAPCVSERTRSAWIESPATVRGSLGRGLRRR